MNNLTLPDCAAQQQILFDTQAVVINLMILGPLCLLGLAGNLVGGSLLIRSFLPTNIFRHYLIALCLSDGLMLGSSLMIFSLPVLIEITASTGDFYVFSMRCVYPLSMVAQTSSTWLLAAITVVRYLSVEYPFFVQRWTCGYSKRFTAYVTIGSVYCCSLLYNIPRFLEIRSEPCWNKKRLAVDVMPVPSLLRKHPTYILLYTAVCYDIFMCVVPFSLIIALSARISARMKAALRSADIARNVRYRSSVNATARLFAFISILFLVCNILPFVANIIETIITQLQPRAPSRAIRTLHTVYVFLSQIGNILVCFNASCNFLLYLTFSRQFRLQINAAMTRRLLGSIRNQKADQKAAQSDQCLYVTRKARARLPFPLNHDEKHSIVETMV